LCRRLEGLPLALELAAARISVLTPRQILERLSERFTLLSSRRRDVEPRHRSLWAALDWSYHLLSPELQRFFARLSVFRAGWTLEAAEAVCEAPLAFEHLDQLRECSLVLVEERSTGGCAVSHETGRTDPTDLTQCPTLSTPSPAPEYRFRMLETVREYAAERLSSEERAEQAQRHLAYYVTLAEAAEPELTGPDQAGWLERLDQEIRDRRPAVDDA